ncbi:DUF6602 domain-containing protein [Paenibacillus sp. FSL H8-0104]|uniref:DUF6602 domain-containing protein n=1 Tax=Paenibacillus sp. FSL H8-0104 TaxID=2954509 RepID=UPI0030FD3040
MTKNEPVDSKEEKQHRDVLKRIYMNYDYSNRRMVEEMELSTEHGGLTGGYREGMWLSFFRSIIPLKYQMAQGVIIIDSGGRVSQEVDIAVYDEQYTPYVFQYNTLKFIPIEAVVMVIECKSTSYEPKELINWCNSIQKLEPVASGIARIVQGYATGITNRSQSRTRPIRMLVSLKESVVNKEKLKSIKDLGDSFDFILEENRPPAASKEKNKRFVLHIPHKDKTLGWWGEVLNRFADTKPTDSKPLRLEHLDDAFSKMKELEALNRKENLSETERQQMFELESEIKVIREAQQKNLKEKYPELSFSDQTEMLSTLEGLEVTGNALLTLNLQLNQLLMLINNPMMFPHYAYAKAFNNMVEKTGIDQTSKSSDLCSEEG